MRPLSLPEAYLVCAALIAVDILARALRIRWILRGLGTPIRFRDAITLNAFGDAASALTPLRFGGEPARLGGMLRAGVPAAAGLVAIGLETIAAWPVIILAMLPLVWRFAPEWWTAAAPRIGAAAVTAWPWVVVIGAMTVAAWLVARRQARLFARQVRRPMRRVAVYWRRAPIWPLMAGIPLTLLDLFARVGVLVALALTLPAPSPLGTLVVGSFLLLYAQLILPTPAGIGVVDFSFLAGAAGQLGGRGAELLLAWRFFTSGVGLILGVGLAARIYGWPALALVLRRRGAAPSPPA